MSDFLTTTRLTLTPLAPIHIGADEDFEPTNYVITDQILYGFDPALADLSDGLRKELATLGGKGSLLEIQKFFNRHADKFSIHAKTLIPVASGIAQQYRGAIGQVVQREADGNSVINNLSTQRTSYNPFSGLPYIPGSSFKGALRTALLDRINNGKPVGRAEKSNQFEARLLEGDFHTSPFRLLKIADFMPQGDVAHKIVFAINKKKRRVLDSKTGKDATAKGPATRKEVIVAGQYRCFTTEAVLQSLGKHADSKDAPKLKINNLQELAQCCNAYYLPRLKAELAILNERNFCDPAWYTAINSLLGELDAKLKSNQAFLIRLGRYGDAETKTLSEVAQIKIMQGKNPETGKSNPAKYESQTKTLWLAGNTERDTHGLLPFGWALVEINPQQDLPALKTWCEEQPRDDMSAIWAQHTQARENYFIAKQAAKQRELEAAVQEAARLAEEAARKVALEQMSENLRRVEKMGDDINKLEKSLRHSVTGVVNKTRQNQGIDKDAKDLVNEAIAAGNWTEAEKTALKNLIANELPKVVENMKDAKEQRKRFQLSKLT